MSDLIYPKAVWQEGTLENDVPANDNSLRDEVLAREVLGVENSPTSSNDGDVFIVGAAPTGAFSAFDEDDITIYRGGTWYAWAPIDELQANGYQYTGGAWVAGGGGGGMTNPMTTAGDIIIGGASGTPTRLAVGTSAYVLTVVAGVPAWAAAAGGVTGWTASDNTSSPNNTVNAARMLVASASTNADAVIQPKGTGAFQTQLADNTTTGGNKRGTSAVDLQLSRGNANQVASGAFATIGGGSTNRASAQAATVPGGRNCQATGQDSFASGNGAVASGDGSFAFGGSSTTASGTGSIALNTGTADAANSWAWGSGSTTNLVIGSQVESTVSGYQRGRLTLAASTTNATPTTLTSNLAAAAATNQLYLGTANNRSAIVRGMVIARQTGNSGGKKTWTFMAHLDRDAGTMALVAAVTPAILADSGVAWTIAVTADNTLKTLKVEATGAAATTIRWACELDWQEVQGT